MLRSAPLVPLFAAALALGSVACVAAAEEEVGGDDSAVISAESAHDERPEIGRVGACTGTLVATNVVLTASHCFDHQTGPVEGLAFVIDRASGSESFAAAEVRTFGTDTGESDLALVRLAEHVPAHVAAPMAIASVTPSRRAPVTMYGYGCTERPIPLVPSQPGNVITAGQPEDKRKASFGWGDVTRHACPGDSGGPVVDAFGEIVGVVSAYVRLPEDQGGGFDVFADPVARRTELTRMIRAFRLEL